MNGYFGILIGRLFLGCACGDYLISNLVLEETEAQPIGKYGHMRKRYLKEHRPVLYLETMEEAEDESGKPHEAGLARMVRL